MRENNSNHGMALGVEEVAHGRPTIAGQIGRRAKSVTLCE